MSGKFSAADIKLKRAYEPAAETDGQRILVDRLWPRGVSRAKAEIDLWAKEIAPSTALRKWFGHDPARWKEFRERYAAQVRGHQQVRELRRLAAEGPLTLVYSARDTEHNDAIVLREVLLGRSPARKRV